MNSTIDVLARTVRDDPRFPSLCWPAGDHNPLLGTRLAPPGHGSESSLQTECLLAGNDACRLAIRVKFLHPVLKRCGRTPPVQESLECEVALEHTTLDELAGGLQQRFVFPPALELDGDTERFHFAVEGAVEVTARLVGPRLYRITARIENRTPSDRDSAALRTMTSAHIIMQVHGGEFVSPAAQAAAPPPDEIRFTNIVA